MSTMLLTFKKMSTFPNEGENSRICVKFFVFFCVCFFFFFEWKKNALDVSIMEKYDLLAEINVENFNSPRMMDLFNIPSAKISGKRKWNPDF